MSVPSPPRLAWRRSLTYGGSEPLVVADGRVFAIMVEEHRSALAAFDVRTGRTLWEHPVKHWPSCATCRPLLLDGRLYYPSYDALLVIDAVSGAEVGRGRLPGGTYVTVTPGAWRDLLLLPTASRTLLALQRDSLVMAWDEPVPGVLDARPVATDDGRLYVAANKDLRCLETTTGHRLWGGNGGERTLRFCHPPVVLADRLVVPVGDENRAVLAMDRADGRPLWRTLLEGDRPGFKVVYGFDAPCLVRGAVVYSGSPDGCLYALSLQDGAIRWRVCTGGPILAPPLLLGEALVFGSCDGHVYAADARTGRVEWTHETSGEVWNTPCIHDGQLLFTSLNMSSDAGEGWLSALKF